MERISLDAFKSAVNNCKEVEDDYVKVRKLINLTSKKTLTCSDLLFIKNINSNIFLKAYKELYKEHIEDMVIVNDMVVAEYAFENVISSDVYEDEEEVY